MYILNVFLVILLIAATAFFVVTEFAIVKEMIDALANARYDENVGVIVLTGQGEDAFCSGGDQKIRGDYGFFRC